MKKLISLFVILALVLALIPATAMAAEVTVTDAAGLASAIANAADGDTIKLGASFADETSPSISKTLTLDLNGFTVTNSTTDYLIVNGGNLTIKDSSAAKNGALIANNAGQQACPVTVKNRGSLTVENGSLTGYWAAVYIRTGSTLTVNGGTLAGTEFGIGGNGNDQAATAATTIIINNGAVSSTAVDGSGIYHPQIGTLNINGGSVSGVGSGIAIKSGTLNVTGGTIRCTGADTSPTVGYSNGVNASGAAIQVESNDAYAGGVVVNITNGNIKSDNGIAIYEYLDSGNKVTEVNSVAVSGGNVESGVGKPIATVSSELATASNNQFITGGTFNNNPMSYMANSALAATVNPDSNAPSFIVSANANALSAAISALPAGTTVEVFAPQAGTELIITTPGIIIKSNSPVVINGIAINEGNVIVTASMGEQSKVYKITQGDGFTWGGIGGLTMTIDGPFGGFRNARVDALMLGSGDISVSSGSTVVTFSEDFLKTLNEGKHYVYFTYSDGYAAGSFNVARNSTPVLDLPQTGGASVIGFALMAFIGAAGCFVAGKKNK